MHIFSIREVSRFSLIPSGILLALLEPSPLLLLSRDSLKVDRRIGAGMGEDAAFASVGAISGAWSDRLRDKGIINSRRRVPECVALGPRKLLTERSKSGDDLPLTVYQLMAATLIGEELFSREIVRSPALDRRRSLRVVGTASAFMAMNALSMVVVVASWMPTAASVLGMAFVTRSDGDGHTSCESPEPCRLGVDRLVILYALRSGEARGLFFR